MLSENGSRAFWNLANRLMQHEPASQEWINQQWALACLDDPISVGEQPTLMRDELERDRFEVTTTFVTD